MFQFDWEQKHWKSDAYIMSSYQVVTWSCSSWSGPGSVVLFFFFLNSFFGPFSALFDRCNEERTETEVQTCGKGPRVGLEPRPAALSRLVHGRPLKAKPVPESLSCYVIQNKDDSWLNTGLSCFFFHQWIFSDSDCEIRDHETFSHMDWPQSLDINHTESLGGAVRLSHQRDAQLGQGQLSR